MRILKWLVVFWVFALPAAAQDEVESPFTLYSEDPVIAHGASDEVWDSRYTDPGAVVYHDGQFHMFRNAFASWPGKVQIVYHTSSDGLTWTQVGAEPVIDGEELAYGNLTALAASAIVLEDGTWALYYYTWEDYQAPARAMIGRATAPAPTGPWAADPEPVLLPGAEGEWDSLQVNVPRVLQTDEGFVMFYGGSGQNADQVIFTGIGMATSEDGVAWTKYNDPDTTDAPFSESDPVLISDEAEVNIHQPNVVQTDEGYAMLYRRFKRGLSILSLNSAFSEDGITWETDAEMWAKDSLPRSNGFWMTALTEHDGTYYLYIEGGRGRVTDIYAATGSLAESE